MKDYRETQNPETGATEFLFNAKLVKVSDKVLENSKGTNFKIVTLNFDLPNGENVERTAICYEGNYQHGIEEGKTYVSKLSFDDEGNPQLMMSHLEGGKRATMDDFIELYKMEPELV